MNRNLRTAAWIAVLVAGSVRPAWAETLQDRFRSAVEAFEAGRYEEAANTFADLRERYHVESPDLLVNEGAAHFMAGRPGQALLRFHEAVRLAPGSRAAEVAEVNAQRVRAALNERGATTGFVFGPYHDAWTALFGWVPAIPVTIVALVFWAALFGLLIVRRLTDSARTHRPLAALIAIAACGVVLSGIAAFGAARVAAYEVGVIVAPSAPLLDRPDSLTPALVLPEALEVRILDRFGGFVRVRLSSGQEGLIPERSVGVPRATS